MFAQTPPIVVVLVLLLLLLLVLGLVVYHHRTCGCPPPPRVVVRYVVAPPVVHRNKRVPVVSVPVPSSSYTSVGYLSSPSSQRLLPLYARPSPTHRSRYNYFTRPTHEERAAADVRLPVIRADDGRDCTQHLGCEELYDQDTVRVPGLPEPFTVHRYAPEFTVV